MEKLINEMLKSIESYNFNEPADYLIYILGYLQDIEELESLRKIIKKIYDVL